MYVHIGVLGVFWLAYDSPGGPCLGTERSILIQRNYPLTANSFYSHTPRQWCRYLFISISSPARQEQSHQGQDWEDVEGRSPCRPPLVGRSGGDDGDHYGATTTTAQRHSVSSWSERRTQEHLGSNFIILD